MHNFRYHLVTIVSIFISLLIGLLLGATIAGSDLVNKAGSDMINSLSQRFDDLSSKNEELDKRLNAESSLAFEFFEGWAGERLDGRTIVILAAGTNTALDSVGEIHKTLRLAGAATVRITVHEPSFGIGNFETLKMYQELVPPVDGQRYEDTIAEQLVSEWTYMYVLGASTAIPDVDLSALYNLIFDETVPQTTFQRNIYAQYPLTRLMVANKIITIETDYLPLLEHSDSVPNQDQVLALEFASSWQIPYGVNGIINTLTLNVVGEAMSTDTVGIQIASVVNRLGLNGSLPYPAWLANDLLALVGNETAANGSNYFALLVDIDSTEAIFTHTAYSTGISSVIMTTDVNSLYSIVALLSGAKSGSYGQDSSISDLFPELPLDTTGRIPFAK